MNPIILSNSKGKFLRFLGLRNGVSPGFPGLGFRGVEFKGFRGVEFRGSGV